MKTAADNNFNEALQQQLQQNNLNSVEVVYDVPRSNPRKVENSNPKPKEAIYVNDSFSEHLQKNYHADSSEATTTVITNNNADGTYDIPRNVVSRVFSLKIVQSNGRAVLLTSEC